MQNKVYLSDITDLLGIQTRDIPAIFRNNTRVGKTYSTAYLKQIIPIDTATLPVYNAIAHLNQHSHKDCLIVIDI